jgi:hypothetical protein
MENPHLFWETGYAAAAYTYGVEPNRYFQRCLDEISEATVFLDEGAGHAGLAEVTRAHFQKRSAARPDAGRCT